mmetsp:Transcript_6157/g.14715  ORF Transcript_6157/g.14715 Transcript_6157/m.14715 type:complete len:303 (-) Transcript_6157:203-1111(-)
MMDLNSRKEQMQFELQRQQQQQQRQQSDGDAVDQGSVPMPKFLAPPAKQSNEAFMNEQYMKSAPPLPFPGGQWGFGGGGAENLAPCAFPASQPKDMDRCAQDSLQQQQQTWPQLQRRQLERHQQQLQQQQLQQKHLQMQEELAHRVHQRLQQDESLSEQGYVTPPSRGSVGHPRNCRPPCKYIGKTGGCQLGANCGFCHLCRWRHLGRWQQHHTEQEEDSTSSMTGVRTGQRDAQTSTTDLQRFYHESAESRILGEGEPVSLGSLGHPYRCGPACRYRWRVSGCRNGADCLCCHFCHWRRLP